MTTVEEVIEAAKAFYEAWLADVEHNNAIEVYPLAHDFKQKLIAYERSEQDLHGN